MTVIVALSGGCHGPYSTLDPAGPAAGITAMLWWGMFAFFSLVWAAVISLWLYAQFLRRKPARGDDDRRSTRLWIIGAGVVLPLSSIGVLLAIGIPAGNRIVGLSGAQEPALRIEVTGHQWWWDVYYPASGIRLRDELHIPAGTPVELHLASADVIHSFWVPRLAGKLDLIPGRTNVLRLQADAPGTYRGQCAEFCGLMHAHMRFELQAHAPDDFALWLETQPRD